MEPNDTPFGPEYVKTVLRRLDPTIEVLHFDATTFTSQDAADAIGCELGQIAKSLCLFADGNPFVVVMSGDHRVSDAKLAKRFQVGRKKIKIAKRDECIEVFGYEPGGVSPVGHRTAGVPILLDETLRRWEEIWAAAGSSNDNFMLTFDQLRRITDGEVLDCAKV
jgi:prolyl-tRNA editing enzyme YbaK/EbsC (Cys-tRNA(Pro) deacylase)